MNMLIPILLVLIVVVLIFKSMRKSDPAAEDCAKELTQVIRDNPKVSAEELATIFRAHGRSQQDAGDVTVLVKTRLSQTQVRKDDHDELMSRIRKAKSLLD